MYELNSEDLKYPPDMEDSPPIYPTPMTPPHIRPYGYRTKYLQKRDKSSSEFSNINMKFDEGGFNYFEYIQ